MIDRLSKVAGLLGATYGQSWEDMAQLVRTGVIALRSDVADCAAGDTLEREGLPLRTLGWDREAAEDTISVWFSAECIVDPAAVAVPSALATACQRWAKIADADVPTAATIRTTLEGIYGIQWRTDKRLGRIVRGVRLVGQPQTHAA